MSGQAIEWTVYGLLLVALVIAAIYSVAADTARLDSTAEKAVFCAVCYVGLVIAGANSERRL